MIDLISGWLGEYGYAAVCLLMILENVFPPIPSEVILPYVGHQAALGELNLLLALLAAVTGSLIGTSLWFAFGWLISVERLRYFFVAYGGYIAITARDFERAARLFERFERSAVFWGRMLPGIRSVISVPAGSVHMSSRSFLLISAAGILIWNTFLIWLGYAFLNDPLMVERYINPIANVIIVAAGIAYLVQVVRFWRQRASQAGDAE